jgi:hypothetical protein
MMNKARRAEESGMEVRGGIRMSSQSGAHLAFLLFVSGPVGQCGVTSNGLRVRSLAKQRNTKLYSRLWNVESNFLLVELSGQARQLQT